MVKVEIPVEAPTRSEAWEKAKELLAKFDATVLSIPQQPEEA